MATVVLPFTRENKNDIQGKGLFESGLYDKLSPPLKEATKRYPHLLEYLHMVPISEVGIPDYYSELTRKLGDIKEPNLIYPTKREGVFIHILANSEDPRNDYITIEPTLTVDINHLMVTVDEKLLELRTKLKRVDEHGDREEQLSEYIDQVITLEDEAEPGFLSKYLGFLRKGGPRLNKLKMTKRERDAVRYLFIREKLGLGTLDPLTTDPFIEDISCSGLGQIFIEHKIFSSVKSSINFETIDDLDGFVMWLSERIKKPVTFKTPICDATLPDGSRINIVYGKEVSKRGSNFSIRKFAGVPISIFELIDFGSLNYQMLAYLSLIIGHELSLFVSGETASGKTTLLNALTTFIQPLAKIVSIEDTPELQVPHQNWIREVVQTSTTEDAESITMFDLLMAALRQRPNEIIIGEIRGAEGNVAFQAMQTGHSVMATFHAATVEKLIQRLTGDPILVPKTYIDNLNVVVLCSQVRLPNGRMGRRITGIAEIVGYDPSYDSFTFMEAFHWDETTDEFQFTGYMTSYMLETVIAPKMGIPSRKKQRIYAEVERRARILKKLHEEEGISDFYEILDVLAKAQREGYF